MFRYSAEFFVKGRQYIYRYTSPSPLSVQVIIAEFQLEYLSSGLHPNDLSSLTVRSSAGLDLRIRSGVFANHPLYFLED